MSRWDNPPLRKTQQYFAASDAVEPTPVTQDNRLPVTSEDWFFAIAAGSVPGWTSVDKFATATVGTTDRIVWNSATTVLPFPVDAAVLNVVSDDPNDTAAGSGARKLHVYGLDANWDLYDEEVELDGTTPVPTTGTFVRVYRAFVSESGTYGGGAAGTITVTHQGTGTLLLATVDHANQTLQSNFTIPRGYRGFVYDFHVSVESGKSVEFHGIIRPAANVTSAPGMGAPRHITEIAGMIAGVHSIDYQSPTEIPEYTDLWAEASVASGTADISLVYHLILEQL